MDDPLYYEARAAQCRRLAAGVNDAKTTDALRQLAREYDASAEAARSASGPQANDRFSSPDAQPTHDES
jgi:hypothetical protein